MTRLRRLKRENTESDSSSCGDKNSRYSFNAASDGERSDDEQSVQMNTSDTQKQNGYSYDTVKYFSAGEFKRKQRGDPQETKQKSGQISSQNASVVKIRQGRE